MQTDAARIMSLFEGYADAYGTHGKGIANVAKGGKLEIRTSARTISQPVTEEVWAEHLSGKSPLGVFAIRRDSTCMWGAVDVDDYTLTHGEIVQKLKREKLPMVVCRTKSGGAHIYCFLTAPIAAEKMIGFLRRIASMLGFGSSEIFPKQSHVLWDSGDFGSWLNMPYLGGDKTERYAVNEHSKGMTLRQFLDAAETARMDPDDLDGLGTAVKTDPQFGDGPPCLQAIALRKFQRGEQNNGLMAMGVLAKKKYPDKWQVVLTQWANDYFDPSIPADDDGLRTVISGLQKKQYRYKCKDQPIVSFCNSALCRTRKHGVGGGSGEDGGGMPKLSSLAVLNTEEPLWFLDVENVRVQFSTNDLLNYAGFQAKVLAVTHTCPPMLKRDSWVQVLQGLLVDVVVIDAPDEAGISGQFFEILEMHLTDRQRAATREELLLGKAWWDDDTQRVYFRLRDIQEACERMRFRAMNRTQMVSKIKELGGEPEFAKLRGKGVNMWSIPQGTISQQTEPHVTPKAPEAVI